MADSVFLHVGTPKSGTTYLQALLWSNRRSLRQAGLRYPAWAPEAHFLACLDMQGAAFNGFADPEARGAWGRLVRRIRREPGTAVVSHELFGDASAQVAAGAVADLAPAEAHLVVTVRDLARQLPAAWQEDVKNRHVLGFGEWLAGARPDAGARTPSGDAFWHRQDVPAVLDRWTTAIPRARTHIVVVPPAGSAAHLLWHRFASVLGVDPALAQVPPGAVNTSLGAVEVELLRRLNARLNGRVDWPAYAERVTRYLAPRVLVPRASRPVRLPAEEHPWVAAAAADQRARLAAGGYDVVGDLAELDVAQPAPVAGHDAPPATEAELLDAALDALGGMIGADAEELMTRPSLADRAGRRLARILRR